MDVADLYQQAKNLYSHGDIEEARDLLEKYSDLDSKKITNLKISIYSDLFMFDEALKECHHGVEKYPGYSCFVVKASKLYLVLGNQKLSVRWLDRAIRGDYKKYSWKDQFQIIELLCYHNRFDEMHDQLDSMDDEHKETAKWLLLKGWVYSAINKPEEAKKYYALGDIAAGEEVSKPFLISHPKTGYTWLRYILVQLIAASQGEDLPYKSLRLLSVSKKLDSPILIRTTHDGSAIRSENGLEQDLQYLYLHDQRQRYKDCDIIMMVRDPRDSIVSLYHQLTKRTLSPLNIDMEQFIRHSTYGISRTMRFYSIWEKQVKTPRKVLLISYEGMLKDPKKAIEHVVDFLKIPNITSEVIEQIIDITSADKMRESEKKNEIADMRVMNKGDDALKVRKAKSGSYKEEMSFSLRVHCWCIMRKFPKIFKDLIACKNGGIRLIENH